MMRIALIAVASLLALTLVAPSIEGLFEATSRAQEDESGLIVFESPFPVARTADRLTSIAEERGLNIFTQVDHAAGAQRANLELRPTRVVIFGNPNVGTPFMQCSQSVGIDLPQKALIWKDADGTVRLAFNDPSHLAIRHGVSGKCHDVVSTIEDALRGLGQAVVDVD